MVREPLVVKLEREQCFRLFVSAHCERAWRLAWRLVGGNDAAAEKVIQKAFVKAYRNPRRFREEAGLAIWFYRIVVRQACNYCRWRTVQETWRALWHGKRSNSSCQDSGDGLPRRRIAKALTQLSWAQREAFVLVHLEGFSMHETAVCMGKAEGIVQSHAHRAMQTLQNELADLTEATRGSQA
jgi:RNA polymerase sigma-70 factor (ECF subfamily)